MALLTKLAGVFLILFGVFLVRYFPGIAGEWQPAPFANAAIIIGFLCIGVGAYAVWKL